MDDGAVRADSEGRILAAWQRKNKVFATAGTGTKEVALGDGNQPWIASGGGGTFALFVDPARKIKARHLDAAGEGRPLELAGAPTGNFPCVAASPGTKVDFAAWEGASDDAGSLAIHGGILAR